MQTLAEELEIIIAATALIFVITTFVAVFLIAHQRRSNRHLRERREMKQAFEKESLKVELEVKERTLHTISQEIHDNIGQLLSLVNLNLNTLDLKGSAPEEKLRATQELVSRVINELRNLSKTMNSDYLKFENLGESLKAEFELIKKMDVFDIQFKISGEEEKFSPEKRLIIYRIAQEIINNIVKHANAKQIACELNFTSNQLDLSIADNGIGFNSNGSAGNNESSGTGLRNLHHRANLIGGGLQITSTIGEGTKVHLSVPMNS